MSIKITRQKRPENEKVTCEWGKFIVELEDDKDVWIWDGEDGIFIPLSEIPNLIKALEEVAK